MSVPPSFNSEEIALLADAHFFRKKAQITAKVKALLESTRTVLARELTGLALLAPAGFDPTRYQFVKGEHLEDFPYQYLDCPKHFDGADKFTYRTLFWWGHHVACALIVEGAGIKQYKRHLVDRFHQVAGQGLELSLAPSLWEWKRGEGYTLPITHDRKARIAAVLAERSFIKLMRCVPLTDPLVQAGSLPDLSRDTFRALLPVIVP